MGISARNRLLAMVRGGRFLGLAWLGLIVALASACSGAPSQTQKSIILATTTSTYDTGLLDVLIPDFEKKTGYTVKPIAVGTGRALAMGRRGEADVLLVHAPSSEKKLLAEGAVVDRRLVMHNYFAIVGPAQDPAGIKGGQDAVAAFRQIASARALFISRGDDSGTHKMEKRLWAGAGIEPGGAWYQETGQGMGQTLMVASEKGGYTLTDRGTFLSLKKNLDLEVMVEGDAALLNVYSVLRVNPERFPKVNGQGGKAFADYLVSPQAQAIIRDFGTDRFGEPLFIADAGKREEELRR
jgi:tungstate transport system substrate-binding protein